MDEQNVDRFAMLLSTDWFLEFWPRIGIVVSKQEAALLQEGFRDIVRHIVLGAEQYWLASFSVERIQETYRMLQKLLKSSGVRKSVTDRIGRLAAGWPQGLVVDETTAWVLTSITRMLSDNSLTQDSADSAKLDRSIRSLVITAYANSQPDSIDLEQQNLQSKSRWDEYVRKLTPDLPTYLSDYLSAGLLKQTEFERFWDLVRASLTPEQREEVLNWYRAAAHSIYDEEISLPASLWG